MSLTNEQILLLENLTYLNKDAGAQVRDVSQYEGKTVGEWLAATKINTTDNPNAWTTGKEWNDIINAIKNDPVLMDMKIVDTHIDNAPGGGGGKSVVFVSEQQNEAVVAFAGTAKQEWHDDFMGAQYTDTPQQKNALDWYQSTCSENNLDQYSITVTGHSKGGNKAKYITLLDDSVDRCVSFDGQGFSDEFYEKYHDQIIANQDKITNMNAEGDYVNILLNDVGKTTYYEAQNLGAGGFLENHCANTMLKFEEDGSYSMVPTEQSHEMQAVDHFLNSYIRSIPVEERGDMIDLLGKILTEKDSIGGNMNDTVNYFIDLATDPKYSDDLAYLMAFTIKYSQEHPEMMDEIRSVMEKAGLGEYVQYVDMAQSIMNFEYDAGVFGKIDFQDILGFISGAGGMIPGWLMAILLKYLEEKTGLRLTTSQVYDLLKMLGMISGYMETANVNKPGADLHLHSPSSSGGSPMMVELYLNVLKNIFQQLLQQAKDVAVAGDEIDTVLSEGISDDLGEVVKPLRNYLEGLRNTERSLKEMHTALENITNLYDRTEKEIASTRFV